MKTFVEDTLSALERQGLYRETRSSRAKLDFSSNDYLGLRDSSSVRSGLIEALAGGLELGAGASRVLGGTCEVHERVEAQLAHHFEHEAALLFSSGYAASLGVVQTFREARFFSDAVIHASWIEALRGREKEIYRHNDIDDLRTKLRASRAPVNVILTESVYSMDGDLAPLEEIAAVANEFNAWLVVDEAHATGVFGTNGRGRARPADTTICVHSGGKALGAQGAFVTSTALVRSLIVNRAKAFIFSTGLSPIVAYQIGLAIRELTDQGRDLLSQANRARERLRTRFELLESASQIIPIVIGGNSRTVQVAKEMSARGFDLRAVRSPTVPVGTERLRVSLKSFLTSAEVDLFLEALLDSAR